MSTHEADEALKAIRTECMVIQDRIVRFDITEQSVSENRDHLDLICLPLVRIGEIVASENYYDALCAAEPDYPWHAIRGIRNRLVHAYGKTSPMIIWKTALADIPKLLSICDDLLKSGND